MGSHGFRRTFTGAVVLRADEAERQLLASLLGQVEELVSPDDRSGASTDPLALLVGIDEGATRPDDPVLERLLPDAYPDDVEASAEFRRFTERSLRETKAGHARTVLAALESAGDRTTIPDDDVPAWMGALNDLRLALGTRLGVTEDTYAELAERDPEDPAAMPYHLYDWLTFLQETLVQAVSGLRSEPPPGR